MTAKSEEGTMLPQHSDPNPLSLAGANDTADGFAKHSFPPQQAPDRHCAATALIPTDSRTHKGPALVCINRC